MDAGLGSGRTERCTSTAAGSDSPIFLQPTKGVRYGRELTAATGSKYFSLDLDLTKHAGASPVQIAWKVYLDAHGWGGSFPTLGEAVADALRRLVRPADEPLNKADAALHPLPL